jgi:hypothetical protein
MIETSERNQSLWWVALSPAIWAMHFVLSYATASIWCGKIADSGSSLWQVRLAIGVYSILALSGIGIMGWVGYRRHRYGDAELPHSEDTPEDRHRFLGFAVLLLSALSAVATVYATAVLFFFRNCE